MSDVARGISILFFRKNIAVIVVFIDECLVYIRAVVSDKASVNIVNIRLFHRIRVAVGRTRTYCDYAVKSVILMFQNSSVAVNDALDFFRQSIGIFNVSVHIFISSRNNRTVGGNSIGRYSVESVPCFRYRKNIVGRSCVKRVFESNGRGVFVRSLRIFEFYVSERNEVSGYFNTDK